VIHLDPTDTIVAVASPPGPAARGLVRLTGDRAWEIALTGFHDASGWKPPRSAVVRTGVRTVAGLRPTLPVMVALWPGRHTYTGQPIAEIHTVGSPPLLSLVVADCLAQGARAAEPGEFTLRAFLTGRIDLTRAEAVLGIIEATTSAQLDAALRQLAGGLAGPIEQLRDRLVDILAHVEAGLDFVDEADVTPLGRAALARVLADGSEQISRLGEQLRGRDRPGERPRVVLVGPPNAGKSRLFNALLGRTTAIVSPTPGTTTDYLSAPCDCAGLTVDLIDTAGIEPPRGTIQAQAQSHGRQQGEQADLVVACQPADLEPGNVWRSKRPQLNVTTKCDLAPSPLGALATSAVTGQGLTELRSTIAAAIRQQEAEGSVSATTAARCRDNLLRAGESLRSASQTLISGGGDELVAFELRQSVDELGKVVGAVVTDDILDRIFRKFCIGK
jgi:tRNA modification GTPase